MKKRALMALTMATCLAVPMCTVDLDSLIGGAFDEACDAQGFPGNLLCDVVDVDFSDVLGGDDDEG